MSGDVNTEAFGNDVSAESVSGDVEVSGQRKDAETDASTVSGNVTLFRVAGVVEAASVSGDVIIDEGSFNRASLETVSGDLIFRGDLRDGGKINAETVNGDIDLDDFKRVNDSLGMNAGDQMLIEVSKRLIDTVRDSDSVGRFSSSGSPSQCVSSQSFGATGCNSHWYRYLCSCIRV